MLDKDPNNRPNAVEILQEPFIQQRMEVRLLEELHVYTVTCRLVLGALPAILCCTMQAHLVFLRYWVVLGDKATIF